MSALALSTYIYPKNPLVFVKQQAEKYRSQKNNIECIAEKHLATCIKLASLKDRATYVCPAIPRTEGFQLPVAPKINLLRQRFIQASMDRKAERDSKISVAGDAHREVLVDSLRCLLAAPSGEKAERDPHIKQVENKRERELTVEDLASRFDHWMKVFNHPDNRSHVQELFCWLYEDEGYEYIHDYRHFCQMAKKLSEMGYEILQIPSNKEFSDAYQKAKEYWSNPELRKDDFRNVLRERVKTTGLAPLADIVVDYATSLILEWE